MKNVMQITVALLFTLMLLVVDSASAANTLPKVYVIATGGTIAGTGSTSVTTSYKPSVLTVEDVIASVDGVEKIAQIEAIQFSNISSQNMSSDRLLQLAELVNSLLKKSDVSGVVITHGTDTMEESAYMLSLLCDSSKPTIFVAAMRPSTALSADGPANLYSAISVAADPDSKGRGAMVVMNDYIFSARDVTKGNTQNVESFYSPNTSSIGVVTNGEAFYTQSVQPTVNIKFKSQPAELPKVAVLYGHIDAEAALVEYLVELGYKGIVYAGVGHGNMNDATLEALIEARKDGVAVVRAARVVSGLVTSQGEVDDEGLGFTSSGLLNPAKAKILLSLTLEQAVGDPQRALELFDQYKF